jgi:hypothetical protein
MRETARRPIVGLVSFNYFPFDRHFIAAAFATTLSNGR